MKKEIFKKKITEIKDEILEVEGLHKGEYDVQAVQYDRLISNSLYNRIMWGNVPKDYSDFCKKGLKNSNDGIITDVGCGTLSFTYKAYAAYNRKDLFLCDLSYEMLKIGKNRIQNIKQDLSNIKFLRSNALDMPFNDNTIETVLNFGLFIILPKISTSS